MRAGAASVASRAGSRAAAPRLWAFSDLHREFSANRFDLLARAPESFDAAIVAGDVDSPAWDALHWLHEVLPGVRLVYVPGNHDYWAGSANEWTMADVDDRCGSLAAGWGYDYLPMGEAWVGGVRVLGTTLWTDMTLGTLNRGQAYADARRGMNDYKRIRRRRSGRHHYVRPSDTRELHVAQRDWLRARLGEATAATSTVVVTHHAPSPRSLPDPHADLNWCYASDLDAMIGEVGPDVWVHGHVHCRRDYRIGVTRVVANPRGHAFDGQHVGWVPDLVVVPGEEG